MRESGRLPRCLPGLVTADCAVVRPRMEEHIPSKVILVRVDSDEGSDEGSTMSLKLSVGDDSSSTGQPMVTVPCGKALVSDSEHDDSSASETSSLINKNDAVRDLPHLDSCTVREVATIRTHLSEHDNCRKHPKKRRRLEPGLFDDDIGTLVFSAAPREKKAYDTEEEHAYDSEKRSEKLFSKGASNYHYTLDAEPPDSLCVLNPSTVSLTRQTQVVDWSGGVNGRSISNSTTPLPVIPGSIVEIRGGIYRGRHGIVKRYFPNQVLVRIPAFSFQIDRWFEQSNMRVLRDYEVLHKMNISMNRSTSLSSDSKNEACESKEYLQSASKVDELDRIDPLPVNFGEESSEDRDGLAEFVSECFDPNQEQDETALTDRDGSGEIDAASEAEAPSVYHGDTAVEFRTAHDTLRKRLTPASFDLQDTLEVVTKVIDEVAGAQRNLFSATNSDREDKTKLHIAAAAIERPQPLTDKDGIDELNGRACVLKNASESVDSSIVEAFAPSVEYYPVQEFGAETDSPLTVNVSNLGSRISSVENDCDELIADIDDRMPTGRLSTM